MNYKLIHEFRPFAGKIKTGIIKTSVEHSILDWAPYFRYVEEERDFLDRDSWVVKLLRLEGSVSLSLEQIFNSLPSDTAIIREATVEEE